MILLAAALLLSVSAQAPSAPSSAVAPSARSEAYYHFSLGLQARLAGDSDEALDEYRRAQKLDPAAAPIRVEAARLLREMGRLDESAQEARAAVGLDPQDADAHLVLAQLEQIQAAGPAAEEALQRAAAEYEEVVRLRPTDGQSLLNLAGLYGQLRKHEDAARAWGQYIALDPGNFEAHVQRGTHLLMAGKSDEAADALKTALELQPGSARAYQILGDIYAGADQADQAVLHYRKALEVEPGNVRIRLALGEVLVQAKRPEEALAEAEAVLAADADNRFAHDLKGRALRDLRRFDEAMALADQALARDAKDLSAAYLKATVAEARRDFASAAAQLERLLARPQEGEDPQQRASNDRAFLLHLGLDYQQLGKNAEAAEAYGRAFEQSGRTSAGALVNQAAAEDLLWSGRSIDGTAAHAIGLVHTLADDPEASALAYFDEHLAPRSAASLACAVAAVRAPRARELRQRLAEVERLYLDTLMKTRDANEGLAAFLERRTPAWEHR